MSCSSCGHGIIRDDDEGDRRGIVEMGREDVDNLHLSHECLSMAYEKFLEKGNGRRSAEETGGVAELPRQGEYGGGIGLYASEWWNGKSPLSKKLVLKDIVEKDVGLEALPPPSFVKGCVDVKRRRAKIKAAKDRLIRSDKASTTRDIELVDALYSKKRKRNEEDIDWEGVIIEALVVHQVKDEEIDVNGQGHNVFNAIDLPDSEYFIHQF